MKSIFEFGDYKDYLKAFEQGSPRGARRRLAEAMGCQPAYVTQILNSGAHLSLEQADRLHAHLGHGPDEAQFFLLLVQKDRAGTASLRQFFEGQIAEILQRRLDLKNRLGIRQTLTLKNQVVYYSSWHYAAIHVAVTIETLRSPQAIGQRLRLPVETVAEALEFLVSTGLVAEEGGRYLPGQTQLQLENTNKLISTLHTQWRLKTVQNLERRLRTDLHSSTVITLSRKDAERVREILASAITSAREVVVGSDSEEIYAFCLDFFRL